MLTIKCQRCGAQVQAKISSRKFCDDCLRKRNAERMRQSRVHERRMILFSPASAMTARSRRHSTAVRSVMKNGEESMACRKMPVERTSILALKCLSIFCDDGLPPPPAVAGACRAHNVGAVAGRPEKISAPAALHQGRMELDIPQKLREMRRSHKTMNLCRQCAYARMPGREKGNAPEGSSGARRKRKIYEVF